MAEMYSTTYFLMFIRDPIVAEFEITIEFFQQFLSAAAAWAAQ